MLGFQMSNVTFSLIAPVAKTGHSVTPCEGMEHRQGDTPIRTRFSNYLMSGKEAKVRPSIIRNPQFTDIADVTTKTTTVSRFFFLR